MFDFLKSKEQLKREAKVKKRRAKLTQKVNEVYEREYEKQFEEQAVAKAKEKAKLMAEKKVSGKSSFSFGGLLQASDKFFGGGQGVATTQQAHANVIKSHTQAHANTKAVAQKSTKSFDDVLKDLPQ